LSSGPRAAVAFVPAGSLDYGRRLQRLRWEKATGAPSRELREGDPAARSFAGADHWIVVAEQNAIPLPGFRAPGGGAGRVTLPVARGALWPAPPHTLRELETCRFEPGPEIGGEPVAALSFAVSDFPPRPAETAGDFVRRLLFSPEVPRGRDPDFRVLLLEDPFGRQRPEVTRHLPGEVHRLLDVGCGAGAATALRRRERPGLFVAGIERDSGAAARTRKVLDRVLEGDAAAELERLGAEGERFDAFLFADVLEHLEDPVAALTLARALALPHATLVASVPNVGHLSVVRDLLLGRFDPVPAGLLDAGHLRWFTRDSLSEALEEAGWEVALLESVPGTPPAQAEEFLSFLSGFPRADRQSLRTYQWIAVARPRPAIG
jgi:SAM-dependent methyltransferase